MAGSVNKVILVGRVGQDPETRNIRRNTDFEIAEFSLATSKSWRDRNTGERKEKTEWHKVKVMNDGLVKAVVRPYVKKGSLLYIEGELETESWEDRQSGQKRYATKVAVNSFGGQLSLIGGGDGERQGGGRRDDRGSNQKSGGSRPGDTSREIDDDIPF